MDSLWIPSPRQERSVKTRSQTAKEYRQETPPPLSQEEVDKSSVVNTPVKKTSGSPALPPGAPRKQKAKRSFTVSPRAPVRKKLNFDDYPLLRENIGEHTPQ